MKNSVIYRRWQMPFIIKIFFWFFLSLPILSAFLPLYDMLSRNQIDWAGVGVLVAMVLFCGFLYALAVRYNRKITKNVAWLAEKMQMQGYVSRGIMPGFVFWPEVSGDFQGHFVLVKFIHMGRNLRLTDLIMPKPLVSPQNIALLLNAISTKKFPKYSELLQNETSYIFRQRGCIVEKPVAEDMWLAFQISTQR